MKFLLFFTILLGDIITCWAQNPLLGDNMVLQRSDTTKISGTAGANTTFLIILSKGEKSSKTTAQTNSDGHFNTTIKAPDYGTGYTLQVGDKTYKNVAVGEVWLLSGQSNMSWRLGLCNDAKSLASGDSMVRITMAHPAMETPRDSMSAAQLADLTRLTPYAQWTGWKISGGKASEEFSGLGQFFAKRLREAMPNVPIGLIQTALGGAPTEAFVPTSALKRYPETAELLDNWLTNNKINEWCRSLAATNIKGATNPTQRHYYSPAYLYDARINPLRGTSVRGVLWYQGESNADNIDLHNKLFEELVTSWREAFGNKNLPFYFVQLSSHDRDSWPAFRNSQRLLAEQTTDCEMVISHDWGNPSDVHPRDKRPIGYRLANTALANLYSMPTAWATPKPTKLERTIVQFDRNLKTADDKSLRGFEVSSDGENFSSVAAVVEGDKVKILICGAVRAVRYGWQPSTDANLCSSEGLPCSTFEIRNDE